MNHLKIIIIIIMWQWGFQPLNNKRGDNKGKYSLKNIYWQIARPTMLLDYCLIVHYSSSNSFQCSLTTVYEGIISVNIKEINQPNTKRGRVNQRSIQNCHWWPDKNYRHHQQQRRRPERRKTLSKTKRYSLDKKDLNGLYETLILFLLHTWDDDDDLMQEGGR